MREGTNSKLSEPIIYIGKTFEERLERGMDLFYKTFLEKSIKPKFMGKDIFFDMDKRYKQIFTLTYPERFLHIVSLDDDEKYTVDPCNNDISVEHCENKCLELSKYENFKIIERWECPYRLYRIHWIREVIELANGKDENINIWEERVHSDQGQYKKMSIRYHCGMDDYLIVLKDGYNGNCFKFTTAFPVVSKGKRKQLDELYEKNTKK